MLRALDVRAPACTQFCGAVRDGCTGVYLDNVYVSVRYGAFQCCGYTNACGQFCFLVPCPAGAVSIALWKPGYSKHTIGAYPVNEACHHSFRLYPTV